jgi:dTMP kinase
MPADKLEKRGVFITFEGGEGTGKSTQMRILAEYLESRGLEICCFREPGGTEIGEKIRTILLDKEQDDMNPLAELMLYEAARAQVVSQLIVPALEAGKIVFCDRFVDSTVAYQGYGRGIDPQTVKYFNTVAMDGCVPDRTILLLLNPEEGLLRATKHSLEKGDRMESAGRDFHQRVYEGFSAIAAAEPERVRSVYTCAAKSDTQLAIFEQLVDLFPGIVAPVAEL